MDPLSAISLAGNIIQFVHFGGRLLSNARELYSSSVGELTINEEITLITTDLGILLKQLKESVCLNPVNQENEGGMKSLERLCTEATAVVEELLNRLGTLRITTGCTHRRWGSLRLAIRSLWSEKEIKSLRERLDMLKDALESRVLFSLRLAHAGT